MATITKAAHDAGALAGSIWHMLPEMYRCTCMTGVLILPVGAPISISTADPVEQAAYSFMSGMRMTPRYPDLQAGGVMQKIPAFR